MTHSDLVERARRWLSGTRGCTLVLTEAHSRLHEQPDAIGWGRSGWSVLVECKASVSDFRADKRKPWRQGNRQSMGQERWYMTTPGLVRPDQLPDEWGLLEIGPTRVRRVVDAAHYPGPRRTITWLRPWAPERTGAEIDALIGAFVNRREPTLGPDVELADAFEKKANTDE